MVRGIGGRNFGQTFESLHRATNKTVMWVQVHLRPREWPLLSTTSVVDSVPLCGWATTVWSRRLRAVTWVASCFWSWGRVLGVGWREELVLAH